MLCDNSMVPNLKPESNTFLKKDILLIGPSMAINPGNFVLAYSKINQKYFFRQYKQLSDPKHFELHAFNDLWPTLNSKDHELVIIGSYSELLHRKASILY